jgi:transcriptional regulator GlxA family with amidase domain
MREGMQLLCERAASLLSANPSLTLHEIARTIGTDRHNIEHALRERWGISFRELKIKARLKGALTLLKEQPGRYVKEIAADVGLTPNHLSRFIRSMTGHCATESRRHK